MMAYYLEKGIRPKEFSEMSYNELVFVKAAYLNQLEKKREVNKLVEKGSIFPVQVL